MFPGKVKAVEDEIRDVLEDKKKEVKKQFDVGFLAMAQYPE